MKRLQETEIFRYIITGGTTTVINYVIFILLTQVAINYIVANSIAWLGAVIFAFYANKHMVFHSQGNKLKEFTQFFSVRILTLFLENFLLYLFVDVVGSNQLLSKIIVSVVTVALNYFACKYCVFKEGKVTNE
ncbi:MAG: GtrA family protein [Anaerovoracaceae bacterium]